MIKPDDKPTISFKTDKEWEKWLKTNYGKSDGIWLRMYKKDTGIASVNYAGALEVALCYGWIDGQKKSFDQESWIQKFTPRRPKSGWSKINTQHVARLIEAGRMRKPGMEQVEMAQKDGRWEKAYDSQSSMIIPEDFLKALGKNKKAKAFYSTLNKSNLYSIGYKLQTAKKPETKEKRIKDIVDMLERGEAFHPFMKKKT